MRIGILLTRARQSRSVGTHSTPSGLGSTAPRYISRYPSRISNLSDTEDNGIQKSNQNVATLSLTSLLKLWDKRKATHYRISELEKELALIRTQYLSAAVVNDQYWENVYLGQEGAIREKLKRERGLLEKLEQQYGKLDEITEIKERLAKSKSETGKSLSNESAPKADITDRYDSDYSDWEYSDKEETAEKSGVKEMPAPVNSAPVNPRPEKVDNQRIITKGDLDNYILKIKENVPIIFGPEYSKLFGVETKETREMESPKDKDELIRATHERINELEKELVLTRMNIVPCMPKEFYKYADEKGKVYAINEKLAYERRQLDKLNGINPYKRAEEKPTKSESETGKSVSNESEPKEADHKKSDAKEYEHGTKTCDPEESGCNKSEAKESDRDSVYSSDGDSTDHYSDWEYSDKEESDSEKSDVKEMPVPVNPAPEKVDNLCILPKEDLMFFKKKLTWITYMVTSSTSMSLLWMIIVLYKS